MTTAANGLPVRPFRSGFNSKGVVDGAERSARARRLERNRFAVLQELA